MSDINMKNEDKKKKKPVITFTKTSPYLVSDLENLTNSQGKPLNVKRVMSLCRCGISKQKPHCDGSHAAMGIDGEKQPGRRKDKVHSFKGKEITIHDNRAVCSYDGSCVKLLPSVFKKGRRPWINPDAAGVKEIVETIEKCPSGALSYTIGQVTCTCLNRPATVKVAKNGPLEITGGIILKDDQDSKPQSTEHYTLCRCGGSKNKPFCDGEHSANGFNDEDN